LEISVTKETVVARIRLGDRELNAVEGDVALPERRRATIDLLAGLVREAMDFDPLSEENSLREDLYRNLLSLLGQELFDALFTGDVRSRVVNELKQARLRESRLRLRLSFDHARDSKWLARLPWEYLHTPAELKEFGGGSFLSTETELILSRRLEVGTRELGMHSAPIRVLLVCASPTAPTDEDPPLREVDPNPMRDALQRLAGPEKGYIELATLVDENPPPPDQAPPDYQWTATREAFGKVVKQFDPVLIHFMGHGRCSHQHGELAFSKTNGKPDWVTDRDFAWMSSQSEALRAVFVQACESALPDFYVGFSGVAQQVAAQGIPAVVAMQYRIAAPVADVFASAFYEALMRDEEAVDLAVKAGRDAIRSQTGADESLSFGLPVLYLSEYTGIARQGTPTIRVRPASGRPRPWHGRCPHCRTAFQSGAKYCAHCGKQLPPYCGNCGEDVSPEAAYCTACGESVTEPPPRKDTASETPSDTSVPSEVVQAFEGPGAL
jgi:hypothetical protein